MPTVYTSDLYYGKPQTFSGFAMECARAFGALVHLRDSQGAEIPDVIEADDYHLRQQQEAEQEFERLRSMSYEEIKAAATEAAEQTDRRWAEARRDTAEKQARYEAMLAEVQAWKPPTKDHQGLKDFMVQQLTDSLRFDCCDLPTVAVQTPAGWHAERFAKVQRDIAYHGAEYAKEVDRAAERTLWIKALRESLEASLPGSSGAVS